jgi:hypothetical protein
MAIWACTTLACHRPPRTDRATVPCAASAVDTLGGRLYYTTFIIDGTRSTVRQLSTGPHSGYAIDSLPVTPSPSDIASLDSFRPGQAPAHYGICPGYSAVVITTKRGAGAPQ